MQNIGGEKLTNQAAAEFLCLSPRTLEHWRYTGRGPKYLKLGSKVLYRREDLIGWLEECERRSTSDPGRAA